MMDIATLSALVQNERVNYVKIEAQPTAPKVQRAVQAFGANVAVLGGQNAQFLLEELERGAVGSMPACEFTDLLTRIHRLWSGGERAEAERQFSMLLPLLVYGLQPGLAWAVHKEILVRRGSSIMPRSGCRPVLSIVKPSLD